MHFGFSQNEPGAAGAGAAGLQNELRAFSAMMASTPALAMAFSSSRV